ncbi:hypothetical protein AMJ40_03900 [candidate division TA06 bacterium DG_26]|uniref:Uncharacterized protein n=1 Tax=candidate division TA06 bacterium DG_26 TaxID=1703771 RepID=A0A0S7WIT7_UNCT6|nr:MAG: hypothetical protein AMJ40_03900 [candidate division TA06 bacterium DG_26]
MPYSAIGGYRVSKERPRGSGGMREEYMLQQFEGICTIRVAEMEGKRTAAEYPVRGEQKEEQP